MIYDRELTVTVDTQPLSSRALLAGSTFARDLRFCNPGSFVSASARGGWILRDHGVRQSAELVFLSDPSQPEVSVGGGQLGDAKAAIEASASWTLEVLGEKFAAEVVDERILITHPKWSLVGNGESVVEAVADLMENAREVQDIFLRCSLDELSPEALELVRFLKRVI